MTRKEAEGLRDRLNHPDCDGGGWYVRPVDHLVDVEIVAEVRYQYNLLRAYGRLEHGWTVDRSPTNFEVSLDRAYETQLSAPDNRRSAQPGECDDGDASEPSWRAA